MYSGVRSHMTKLIESLSGNFASEGHFLDRRTPIRILNQRILKDTRKEGLVTGFKGECNILNC